jgi:hypothetical protein
LASGVIERSESDFVDNDEVVSADLLDGFPDGVVRDRAVEVLDQVDCGEVSDSVPGGDCCPSETDQVVTFPGPGGADEA